MSDYKSLAYAAPSKSSATHAADAGMGDLNINVVFEEGFRLILLPLHLSNGMLVHAEPSFKLVVRHLHRSSVGTASFCG